MQEVSHNANPDLHPLSCFTYCIVHDGGSRGRGDGDGAGGGDGVVVVVVVVFVVAIVVL